ncbi:hypothetical protein ABL78_0978 [Leptomonas seymouri]|uniref:Uncharacterized protein n=1 Tax=Leptomonas seymouri TaxID=5684 RepID=A0A0N0P8G0_LEPSE|nr:hypothetical protein ABL78_0978 [Leptomonas seymouri]|eukprot:KPI89906.1 hypothetical protein ABL78_0978 [Leptomonas seymouri]
MTQFASKRVDVETAVHVLRSACQGQGSTASSHVEGVASLLPSASFLAAHCTPALLSSILDACDATTPVAGGPKKLAMLNAAWKLLLAVASYRDVTPSDYETALVHMMEQLRWGVLTHDWSDKKRVRLAAFFASHLVLAVRAHPQLLLTGSEAAQIFLSHLVRLHYAVCITVATSTRDAEAVTALYEHIVGRLHGVFECLGSAAASVAPRVDSNSGEASTDLTERAAKENCAEMGQAASSTVGELLAQCVSAAAAVEVQEAAGGGEWVRQATATAALSAYLHAVHGLLKGLPERRGSNEEAAAASGSAEGNAGGEIKRTDKADEAASESSVGASLVDSKTLNLLTESLLCWVGHRATHGDGSDSDGVAGEEQSSGSAAAAAIQRDIGALSKQLPIGVLELPLPRGDADVQPAGSACAFAPSTTLSEMWISSLASLWQQWITLCANAEEAESSEGGSGDGSVPSQGHSEPTRGVTCDRADAQPQASSAASLCMHLSAVVLSSITCAPHTSAVSMMALEAWSELFRRVEGAAKSCSSSPSAQRAVVRSLLRVLANMRCAAAGLAEGVFCQRKLEDGPSASDAVLDESFAGTSALLMRWMCAAAALLSYGESALGIETADALAGDGEVQGDDAGSGAANVLLSQLIEVTRIQATGSCAAACSGWDDNSEQGESRQGYPQRAAAVAELRGALVALQRESKGVGRQDAPSAGSSYLLCRRLIQIPGKLHNVIRAFSIMPAVCDPRVAHENGQGVALEQLKLSLLSCSSLLASLTQILQGLSEVSTEPAEDEAGSEEGLEGAETQMRSARVARWVAARLLYEIAAVSVSDSAEDALLLACVRRWTDVAFSGLPSPAAVLRRHSAEASRAEVSRQCGDAVVHADAAGSLLRVAEECTTLDLEKLSLSDSATAALMALIEGDSQDQEDADAVSRWRALQEEEARQWCAATSWARRQNDVAETAWERGEVFALPGGSEGDDKDVLSMPRGSSPTAADYLRGLQDCEMMLQRLHEGVTAGSFVLLKQTHGNKRHREDHCDEGRGAHGRITVQLNEGEHTCMVSTLARIQKLSESALAQLEGGTDAAAVAAAAPSEAPQGTTVKAAPRAGRLEDVRQWGAQVFTLSDTESMGSRRRPSSTEVIDIE